MWKIDKNGSNIVDPQGKIYIPGDLIKVPALEQSLQVKNAQEAGTNSPLSSPNKLSWNEMLIKMLNASASPKKHASNQSTTKMAKLEVIYVRNVTATTAEAMLFFEDGTILTSNYFDLPRGEQGLQGEKGDRGEKGSDGEAIWLVEDGQIKPLDEANNLLSGISKINRGGDILEVNEMATKQNLSYKLDSENAYQHFKSFSVYKDHFIFEDYDPRYWHYFYIYFLVDKIRIVGSLEVPVGLDPEFKSSNVALDYSSTSSINLLFDPKTKKVTATQWGKSGLTMTKVDIYRKLDLSNSQ